MNRYFIKEEYELASKPEEMLGIINQQGNTK